MKAIILYPKVHGTPLCKMVTAAWYSDPQISYTYVIIGPMPPIANKTEFFLHKNWSKNLEQCISAWKWAYLVKVALFDMQLLNQ